MVLFSALLLISPLVQEAPRLAEPRDFEQFAVQRGLEISPDGAFVAQGLRRDSGRVELLLDSVAGEASETFDQASGFEFSRDSHYLAWSIVPDPDADDDDGPPKRGLGLLDLGAWSVAMAERASQEANDEADGEDSDEPEETPWLETFDEVQSWSLNETGTHLWITRSSGADERGNDGIVRDLASGLELPFGSVSEAAWSDDGRFLALCIQALEDRGNGLLLFDTDSNRIEALDSEDARYKGLEWRRDAHDLVAMRELEHEDEEDTSHVVLAFTGVGGPDAQTYVHDPREAAEDAADLRVVDWVGVSWAQEGDKVYFGRAEWEVKPKALKPDEDEDEEVSEDPEGTDASDGDSPEAPDDGSPETDVAESSPKATGDETTEGEAIGEADADADESEGDEDAEEGEQEPESLKDSVEDPAGVEVWHAKDIEVQPLQKNQLGDAEERCVIVAWHLQPDELVELGGGEHEDVALFDRGAYAILTDAAPHLEEQRFGPTLVDLHRVDLASGERALLVERVKQFYVNDPNGGYLLYVAEGQIRSIDLATLQDRSLTRDLGPSFLDTEDSTLTDEKGLYGAPNWAVDSSFVLLYDRYDVWGSAPDASSVTRLSDGSDTQLRYRRRNVDDDLRGNADAEGPNWFQVYGDLTKDSALARLDRDGTWTQMPLRDASIGTLRQAEDSRALAYTVERFNDPIDTFVSGPDFGNELQVGSTHPEFESFRWGRSELVEFESTGGDALQGALFYPADYEPGTKYPMVVYIYELRSQVLHDWDAPSERNAYDTAAFTQGGYFVFQPDIVYRAQNPGLSAIDCVVPGVRAVLERGDVDPERVGLVGHSWGAYQTAFIVTHTDVFAAGVAGAPLTNMISMSMSMYWNWGQTDTWIFHESQGRMDKPFWEDLDTYVANSPIFGMETWNKPLLVTFGDDDGAVDWQQGIEFYNAARLAQKPLVMLVYPGENHGLAKKPNQIDYRYRVRAWFDHYLQGAEPEAWITDGQSQLDRTRELRALKREQDEEK